MNAKRTQPEGEHVLYWMQSTHRFEENWALRFAVLEADRLNRPLIIHQGLDPTYEHASDRIHAFIIANAVELARRADALGLHYHFHLRRRRDDDRRVVDRLAARACLVVTDLYPTAGIAERTARFAERVNCRVVAIESHAVVPSGALEREEYAARTIRPKLAKLLDLALEPVTDRPPRRTVTAALRGSLEVDPLPLASTGFDVADEVARCEIDHSVPAVDLPSGLTAARNRLRAFCDDGLADYDARRPDPNDDGGTSRLSPYLHFGQISPAEVARAIRASAARETADAFLDEFITWRELALNFCLRNPSFGTLDALPDWVQRTMTAHAADERTPPYDLRALEAGATHEPLWNASQLELVRTGVMHNFTRMLWGKSVLLWAPTYADALAWLIHLNNKYGLDGRDPNSYAGIQWCFGKFDRPFAERPLFGTIRPMSLARARSRFDVDAYVRRWTNPRATGQRAAGGR
jgi:deoxyribodipyrimidine photo-lyase